MINLVNFKIVMCKFTASCFCLLQTMGAGIFVVPLLGIVENLAIGKEFGNI